jgi:phosphatidylserine/phosphatidylglycerophosphate/cardiolipin synthase-like enzyme
MDRPDIDEVLARTLADHRMSRGEKKAMRAVLEDLHPDSRLLGEYRAKAFDAARGAISDRRDVEVLDWLEEVVKILAARERKAGEASFCEAEFSPGESCRNRIVGLLDTTRETADLCVYTITDNRISRAILDAHRRGVQVRIITDDDKESDAGSDVTDLQKRGIDVETDHSPHQMHHKFAVFDGTILLTGSYNWTVAAAEHNQENIVVTDDPRLVAPFAGEFEKLWRRFTR